MSEKKRRHQKKGKDGVAVVPFSQKKGLLEFGLTQRGKEFSGKGGGAPSKVERRKKVFSPFLTLLVSSWYGIE